MVEPAHIMVRGEALQAGAHAFRRHVKPGAIQIDHGHGQVVAMVKFIFRQQTAFQAINQGKNFSVSHGSAPKKIGCKEKRPPAKCQRA
jgi:hypothetical protein